MAISFNIFQNASIIQMLILDFLLIIATLVFAIVDLAKCKAVSPSGIAAEIPLPSKSKTIKFGIIVFVIQLLIALVVSQSNQIFILLELAAIPTLLIHIWAKGKGAQDTIKLNIVKRIGALVLFMYSKIILVVIINSVNRKIIYSQTALFLFFVVEAVGIYIVVSHIFLGARIKKQRSNTTRYQDAEFLFTDAQMKFVLIAACIGAFLNLWASVRAFMPFVLYPIVRGVADCLIVAFIFSCFFKLVSWTPSKVMVLLSGIGAIAGLAATFVFTTREYQVFVVNEYVMALRFFGTASNLTMIAFPIALVLIKKLKIGLKLLSYAVTVLGFAALVIDIGIIDYSPLVYSVSQLSFFVLLLVILFTGLQKKLTAVQ